MSAFSAYAPPGFRAAIDLDLSKNEGRPPRDPALAEVDLPAADLARYPDLETLQRTLAGLYDVPADELLVTAGADDALLRLCLATLPGGGEALVASPTFEMIPRYVALAGGVLRELPWPEGPFPTDELVAATNANTAVAFVVSPNNPTGATATFADLQQIATALPNAIVALDAAYAEFAGDDLAAAARSLDNVVIVRTLSKAWGLAGLRVGCAIARPAVLERLRAAGNPMPVSIASTRLALRRIGAGVDDLRDHVACVAREREQLGDLLRRLGARPAEPARGNFVLAYGVEPERLARSLAALGIAVRRFPGRSDLEDAVRIGLPGDPMSFRRLGSALQTTLAPEALLFDMDGVLADVRESYRVAIVETAAAFGAAVTADDVVAAKARGDANDDWQLTQTLMAERGVDRPLGEIIEYFEQRYRELRARERLLVDRPTLRRWQQRYKLAVVTGRPRADAEYFLRQFDLESLFDAVICREDAPLKPDPAPVALALTRLGVEHAWMLGDTIDDLAAARGAAALPIGVGLVEDAAAACIPTTPDLDELLP